jgi:hypothetical protein
VFGVFGRDRTVTYAALILLGTREALGRLLGQSEVVFEYRSGDAPGPAQQREEFRQAALLTLTPDGADWTVRRTNNSC